MARSTTKDILINAILTFLTDNPDLPEAKLPKRDTAAKSRTRTQLQETAIKLKIPYAYFK